MSEDIGFNTDFIHTLRENVVRRLFSYGKEQKLFKTVRVGKKIIP